MQTFWSKIKQSPLGYANGHAWKPVVEYIMENNPKMVLKFDYLRESLVNGSLLPGLLSQIPVNGIQDETEKWKKMDLPPEIYLPVFDAVDQTIMQ